MCYTTKILHIKSMTKKQTNLWFTYKISCSFSAQSLRMTTEPTQSADELSQGNLQKKTSKRTIFFFYHLLLFPRSRMKLYAQIYFYLYLQIYRKFVELQQKSEINLKKDLQHQNRDADHKAWTINRPFITQAATFTMNTTLPPSG